MLETSTADTLRIELAAKHNICTAVVTGTFAQQEWYHCLTCELDKSHKMGICKSCKETCHKGHNVQLGGNNKFLCDCGPVMASKLHVQTKCQTLALAPAQLLTASLHSAHAVADQVCTRAETGQGVYAEQVYYECLTCKLTMKPDGKGICQTCADVCHKGHDLRLAGTGKFYCDCPDAVGSQVPGGKCLACMPHDVRAPIVSLHESQQVVDAARLKAEQAERERAEKARAEKARADKLAEDAAAATNQAEKDRLAAEAAAAARAEEQRVAEEQRRAAEEQRKAQEQLQAQRERIEKQQRMLAEARRQKEEADAQAKKDARKQAEAKAKQEQEQEAAAVAAAAAKAKQEAEAAAAAAAIAAAAKAKQEAEAAAASAAAAAAKATSASTASASSSTAAQSTGEELYKTVIAQLQASGEKKKWTDESWSGGNALFTDPKAPKAGHAGWSQYQWLRPEQSCTKPTKMFVGTNNGADPDDIKQGLLGDCWFLSAISVMCKNPAQAKKILERIFVTPDVNEYGVYCLKFQKNGQPISVVVDDLLPCKPANKEPAFAKSFSKNELWVSLIEKAYSKLHGSYEAIDGGFTDQGLADLTGGIPYRINLKTEQSQKDIRSGALWQKIVSYQEGGFLMGAGTPSGKDSYVLVVNSTLRQRDVHERGWIRHSCLRQK